MGSTRMREYLEKMNTATLERNPYVVFGVKVGILFQIARKEWNERQDIRKLRISLLD
jgi:hypothetical protein